MNFSKSISNLQTSEIRDLMSLATRNDIISFAGGMPDNNLFPIDEMDTIYHNLSLQEKQVAMQYGPTAGLPTLLESLSNYLETKGLPVSENKILITTGSLQAINLLTKVFVDEGDSIITENPCFIGATSAFKSYGAKMHSVPLLTDGIDMDALKNTLKHLDKKPKFFYFTPNFHNPAGTLYSAQRKKEIIELFTDLQIPIIEDDVYSDLFFYDEDKEDLKTLKAINPKGIDVCYTGSFSKILGPGLRLGWMLVPQDVYEKCELVKQSIDACSPSFTQVLADKYLRAGLVQPYTNKVRIEYKKRSQRMCELLKSSLPASVSFIEPRGGFYIWLNLPEHVDATKVLKKAIEKGTVFVTGKTFDPKGVKNNNIRLSFCNTPIEQIEKGIPLIVACLKEFME
jgi:2-aminoadipate transaminase